MFDPNEATAATPYHLRHRRLPVAPILTAMLPSVSNEDDEEQDTEEDDSSSTSNRSSSSQDYSIDSDNNDDLTDAIIDDGEDAVVEPTGGDMGAEPSGGGADVEATAARSVASMVLPARSSRYSGSMFIPGIITSRKRSRVSAPVQILSAHTSGDSKELSSSSSPLSRRERVKQRLERKFAVLKAGQAKLFEAIRACGNRNWKALVPIAAPNTEVEKNATGLLHHATVVHSYITKLLKKNGRDDTIKSAAQEVAIESACGIWQVTRWYRDFFRLITPPSPPHAPILPAHNNAVPS
jgi:hypothetical protein